MAAAFLKALRNVTTALRMSYQLFGVAFGYASGGTVTQATNKTTAFTLDQVSGRIIFASGALAAWTASSATWTNSFIGSFDIIAFHQNSGTAGAYGFRFDCANGTCTVWINNTSSTSLNEAVALEFAIIKGSRG